MDVTTDTATMIGLLRTQAGACAALGSPLYAALLELAAQDAVDDGPTARVLAGHEHDPGPSALALRLLGTAHGIALAGRGCNCAVVFE